MQQKGWISGNGIDYTKSTHFLMPMLGYQKNDFISHQDGSSFLINCHIYDTDKPTLVLVLDNNIKGEIDVNLEMFLYKNDINNQFKEKVVEEDGQTILLVYELDERYYIDFYKFIEGRYSEMSQTYKSKLVGLYGRKSNNKDHRPSIFDVLYPTTAKRKQWAEYLGVDADLIKEVSSKPDMSYEVLKPIEEIESILNQLELQEININNNI